MARKLRVEYPGAVYHLMNRAAHREVIFRGDADRERFVATLGEAWVKTAWEVYALCLMPHYPVCQSPMRVIALIDDPRLVEKILRHLGVWHDPPARTVPSGQPGP